MLPWPLRKRKARSRRVFKKPRENRVKPKITMEMWL
jgi:hypothetical protein